MRGLAIALVALAAVLGGCNQAAPSSPAPAPLVQQAAGPIVQVTAIGCRVLAGKADRRCTPGTTNPDVTQATIASTICKTGWTTTVRPPVSVTEPLKRTQLGQYSETGQLSSFEEDHLIPLELGGAPRDPANLWPEPRTAVTGAASKDHDENRLKSDVCHDRLTLAAAQAQMLALWTHS